uniref:Uncharacterized protein n=1 Tax=Romanomermis culicivorax TaxID=13658 RepID=A0A915KN24_ROMCU
MILQDRPPVYSEAPELDICLTSLTIRETFFVQIFGQQTGDEGFFVVFDGQFVQQTAFLLHAADVGGVENFFFQFQRRDGRNAAEGVFGEAEIFHSYFIATVLDFALGFAADDFVQENVVIFQIFEGAFKRSAAVFFDFIDLADFFQSVDITGRLLKKTAIATSGSAKSHFDEIEIITRLHRPLV